MYFTCDIDYEDGAGRDFEITFWISTQTFAEAASSAEAAIVTTDTGVRITELNLQQFVMDDSEKARRGNVTGIYDQRGPREMVRVLQTSFWAWVSEMFGQRPK
jgi:hypothetical protein